MSDYQKVIIKFRIKTRYYSEPMELDVSSLKPNPQSLNILLDTISFIEDESKEDKEIVLQAPIETWNELFTKQIIRFIDERGYNSNFVKRIMKDDYKKVVSLMNQIGEELLKNKTNCNPEKKRFNNTVKGKFLNKIIFLESEKILARYVAQL